MHTWGIYSPGRKLCISEAPNSFQVILNLSISPKVDSGKRCGTERIALRSVVGLKNVVIVIVRWRMYGLTKFMYLEKVARLPFKSWKCQKICSYLIWGFWLFVFLDAKASPYHLFAPIIGPSSDTCYFCRSTTSLELVFFSFLIILRISMNDVCYQIKIRNI